MVAHATYCWGKHRSKFISVGVNPFDVNLNDRPFVRVILGGQYCTIPLVKGQTDKHARNRHAQITVQSATYLIKGRVSNISILTRLNVKLYEF